MDLETIAYLIDTKRVQANGLKPSREPKLSDEFSYDEPNGYQHLERWHDREYAIHNNF